MPSALMTTARTGLSSAAAVAARAIAPATASAVALTAGTNRATIASTAVSASKNGKTLLVRAVGRRAEHVDRIRETRFARQQRRDRSNGLLAELRQLQPDRLAGIRAQDPETSGVRQDCHASSSRHRLSREKSRDVDELLERACSDDTRLMEESVDRGL